MTAATLPGSTPDPTPRDESGASIHEPATVSELGYERRVCAECQTTWPCQEMVKTYCARNYLAHGLGCDCGWHEEKVAQDLEQEKEGSGCPCGASDPEDGDWREAPEDRWNG